MGNGGKADKLQPETSEILLIIHENVCLPPFPHTGKPFDCGNTATFHHKSISNMYKCILFATHPHTVDQQ